jgi:transaldolase
MALYIDSAYLPEIGEVIDIVPVAGITTNPSILLAARERGPMTRAGMQVAKLLKLENYRIAFTAVTSVAQAYTAAMCQADFVIPYFNRLERAGIDASDRIAEMADLFHNQQVTTRILVASIKSPQEAMAALAAGADDITATPQVLLDMLTDPLTEEAIERFTQDWQKIKTL